MAVGLNGHNGLPVTSHVTRDGTNVGDFAPILFHFLVEKIARATLMRRYNVTFMLAKVYTFN